MTHKPVAIACALLVCLASPLAAKKDGVKIKVKSFRPVISADPTTYSGIYIGIDSLYSVEVRLVSTAELAVTVNEGTQATPLRDVVRSGAELAATLSLPDGSSWPFEATFVERDLNGDRAFGLLVVHPLRITDDVVLDRLFCRRR